MLVAIRRVEATEGPIDRYIEELWLPCMRELEELIEREGLSSSTLRPRSSGRSTASTRPSRLPVALTNADEPTAPLGGISATFAGFLGAELDSAPSSFDRPDSVVVGDFGVVEPFRGGGLADRLTARVVEFAREHGCGQLASGVDIDDERALAYYEKLGVAVRRHRMEAETEERRLDA